MTRWIAPALLALTVAFPAWAGTVAVVDFQRAVNETSEGKSAQKKLDEMYAIRKTEIDRLAMELEKSYKDYQSRQLILSEDARAEAEQALFEQQQKLDGTRQQYEAEMQQQYFTLLQGLDEKMRTLTGVIAKEKNYSVVLDRAAVVYTGGDTIDMTDDLIKRYNVQGP